MTSNHKHPSAAFWATVAVVVFTALPLLYVASFGPACWLVRRGTIPSIVVARIFRPIIDISTSTSCPEGIRHAIGRYSGRARSPDENDMRFALMYELQLAGE